VRKNEERREIWITNRIEIENRQIRKENCPDKTETINIRKIRKAREKAGKGNDEAVVHEIENEE